MARTATGILLAGLILSLLGSSATASPTLDAPAAQGFPIRLLDLHVDIHDSIATTRASILLSNPSPDQRLLQFQFPLGRDAVVTHLTLTTPAGTFVGHVQPRDTAKAVFDAAVQLGQSAALLKSSGQGRFAIDVNLAAQADARINVSYVEILRMNQGQLGYDFPLPALVARHGTLERLVLDLEAHSNAPWAAINASGVPDPIRPESSRHARLVGAWANQHPNETLRVRVTPLPHSYTTGILFSGQSPNATVALSLVPPGYGPAPIPLDVVFVLDQSGSMLGSKIQQAQDALVSILNQLRPHDRFALVSFNADNASWRPSLQSPSASNLANAYAWIRDVKAQGATDLEGGLARGLGLVDTETSERLRVVVLISDGLPTAGLRRSGDIVDASRSKNTADARIHIVGIGLDQNSRFLTELATAHRGIYQAVGNRENAGAALNDFYQRISTAFLKDVRVRIEGLELVDFQPSPIPDLYQGTNLVVTARVDTRTLPDQLIIWVDGQAAAGPASYRLRHVGPNPPIQPEVNLLWARQKANGLERQIELAPAGVNTTQARAELLALGLLHGIETLETSRAVVPEEVLRRLQPLPVPSEEPAPGEGSVPAPIFYANTADLIPQTAGAPGSIPPAAPPPAPPVAPPVAAPITMPAPSIPGRSGPTLSGPLDPLGGSLPQTDSGATPALPLLVLLAAVAAVVAVRRRQS